MSDQQHCPDFSELIMMFCSRKDDDARSPTTRCMLNLLDPEEVLDEVFEQERMYVAVKAHDLTSLCEGANNLVLHHL